MKPVCLPCGSDGQVRRQPSMLTVLLALLAPVADGVVAHVPTGTAGMFSPPIVINNFNRLSSLRQQVQFFQRRGYSNLHVLDNNSTYPPLLHLYQRAARGQGVLASVRVHLLGKNYGHRALWDSGIGERLGVFGYPFVYTDADVLPTRRCPRLFLQRFLDELQRWPGALKVGCALRIDDIPEGYRYRHAVLQWEAPWWAEERALSADTYHADIDTTLALYSGHAANRGHTYGPALRVAGAFAARHLPWYETEGSLSAEEAYYRARARDGLLRRSKDFIEESLRKHLLKLRH
eukprot:g7618.t1